MLHRVLTLAQSWRTAAEKDPIATDCRRCVGLYPNTTKCWEESKASLGDYDGAMRRAYIESHCSLEESFRIGQRWAGENSVSLVAPSTRAVEASPWLERTNVPIGTIGNRRSRFDARPHGIVIAWCLGLEELLDLEEYSGIDGVVLVRAYSGHAPWVTAFRVEHLGGQLVPPVDEPSAAIVATVEGLSDTAVLNQGLTDPRERSAAVQALTYLYKNGHQLDPDQLATEAIRNKWPRQAPLELAKIARDLKSGRQIRFTQRLRPSILAEWSNK